MIFKHVAGKAEDKIHVIIVCFQKQADFFIPQESSQKGKVLYPYEHYTNVSPCIPAYTENFSKIHRCQNNAEASILTAILEQDHEFRNKLVREV